jgi:Pyridoxamine 5'-phosphate oxidase
VVGHLAGVGKAARTPGNAWRTPVLATAGDSGGGRAVVLRQSVEDSRELTFHTDLRAPKVSALRTSPWVTWVFYEPRTQVQLRVRAAATIHAGDAVAAEAWDRVPAGSRKNYATRWGEVSWGGVTQGSAPLHPGLSSCAALRRGRAHSRPETMAWTPRPRAERQSTPRRKAGNGRIQRLDEPTGSESRTAIRISESPAVLASF